jgi:hypothetical protein
VLFLKAADDDESSEEEYCGRRGDTAVNPMMGDANSDVEVMAVVLIILVLDEAKLRCCSNTLFFVG